MKETELCRKCAVFENGGRRTISYCLLSECGESRGYGVRIRIAETGERASAADLTQSMPEAEELIDLLATELVTPTTLGDVIEDRFGEL